MISKGRRFRDAIAQKGLVHIMAAHSPLSAVLAEEAGFDGIWASGFELSTLYGLPDVSLISMTQHLDMMRAITDRIDLPVIADVETGFGNAVNVTYAIERYEAAGAAAIVMEDKSFPKVTSLVVRRRKDLLRIEEFQGKVEAACASRHDPDFVIVARTEALIAGAGEEEALRRATAYQEAGADLILVHSKQSSPDEVESFVRAWTGGVPLVLVPTAYPELNADRIRSLKKVAVVIYGNHGIRATVAAMRDVFASILRDGGIHKVNDHIASVEDVFRLQGMNEVKLIEDRYLR